MPTTIHIINYTVFLLLPYSQFSCIGRTFLAVRVIGACALKQVDAVWLIFVHVCSLRYITLTHTFSPDPEDYSSAVHYNVTFRQTVFTDGDVPNDTATSTPILISITDDDVFEGVEYFQAHIVQTSDEFRVRIGQDRVNVTIKDNDSESFIT